jgi:RNA polymerase sigma factor (sigma-70 family)
MDAETNASTIDCAEHLGMVFKVASRILHRWEGIGVDLDDLVQVVYLYMHRCAKQYDPERINPASGKPYRWSTYFYASCMRSQSAIVEEAMGLRRTKGQEGLRFHRGMLAIDARRDTRTGLANSIAAGESGDQGDAIAVRRDIESVVAGMDRRWREVFHLRMVHGRTLVETGAAIGVTRERARQIEQLVIREIKQASRGDAYPALRDWVAGNGR